MVTPVRVDFVEANLFDAGRLDLRDLVKVFEVAVMVEPSMMIVRQEPLRLVVNLVFCYSQVAPDNAALHCRIAVVSVNVNTVALEDHWQVKWGLEGVVRYRGHILVP